MSSCSPKNYAIFVELKGCGCKCPEIIQNFQTHSIPQNTLILKCAFNRKQFDITSLSSVFSSTSIGVGCQDKKKRFHQNTWPHFCFNHTSSSGCPKRLQIKIYSFRSGVAGGIWLYIVSIEHSQHHMCCAYAIAPEMN